MVWTVTCSTASVPCTSRPIIRQDRLDDVLAGCAAATAAGLKPVKPNAVMIRIRARWRNWCGSTRTAGLTSQVIEQMPLDAEHRWEWHPLMADEILAVLGRHITLTFDQTPRRSAPVQLWLD